MKKVIVLRMAFLCLVLLGLCVVTDNHLNAQAFSSATTQGITFVSKEVALVRLDNANAQLKLQLEQLTQGSGAYNETFVRYSYYLTIQDLLNKGVTVADSIDEGLKFHSSQDQNGGLSKAKLLQFKQDAIALLKA